MDGRHKANPVRYGHSDGGGLYLNITASGARSWVFRWKVAGKRREMGLGSLRDVPLAKARDRAAGACQELADGMDPLAMWDKPKVMSFGEAADALIESISSSWRNEKHRAQRKKTLTVYCEPLRSQPVSEIGIILTHFAAKRFGRPAVVRRLSEDRSASVGSLPTIRRSVLRQSSLLGSQGGLYLPVPRSDGEGVAQQTKSEVAPAW